jgi:hypothetical protein
MRVDGFREVLGRRVVDEHDHRLGRVVGIVHHWDGRTSALVQRGPWPMRNARLVSLDSAVVIDHLVHLRSPKPPLSVLTTHS